MGFAKVKQGQLLLARMSNFPVLRVAILAPVVAVVELLRYTASSCSLGKSVLIIWSGVIVDRSNDIHLGKLMRCNPNVDIRVVVAADTEACDLDNLPCGGIHLWVCE